MTETETAPAAEETTPAPDAPAAPVKKATTAAKAAKAKAPKAPKAAKPKAKPTHPPVASMVNAAIKTLKERNGSSLQAIKKYISANYTVEIDRVTPFIRKYLKSAVTKGTLVQAKGKGASGSFKLNKAVKEEKASGSKASKKAKAPKEAKQPKTAAAAAPKAKSKPKPKPKSKPISTNFLTMLPSTSAPRRQTARITSGGRAPRKSPSKPARKQGPPVPKPAVAAAPKKTVAKAKASAKKTAASKAAAKKAPAAKPAAKKAAAPKKAAKK